jgi:NADPH:quinone reductase-like Zn-dependent oxidoreductase
MRLIEVDAFGGPEVLQVREHPDPVASADGYVVEVRAAGLNFADIVERRGRYRRDQKVPHRLGKEAAGVVVARGPAATEFEVGDAVIVVKFDNGCYADRIAAEAHEVLRAPRGLSFVELAAFGTTYATAWWAMHEIARVRPGDSVLVQAAGGGVGTAAINLARTFGCGPIIGTAGSIEKCAVVMRLGADVCVDYTTTDFRPVVRAWTAEAGVDYCLESVGGETYERSLEVMAGMGRVVVIGFSSISSDYATAIPRLHPLTVFHRSFSVGGLNIDNLGFQRRRDIWDRLVDHAETHRIRPHVGQTYPFARVADAHRALEQRETTGKVVLMVHPDATDIPGAALIPEVLDLRDRTVAPS